MTSQNENQTDAKASLKEKLTDFLKGTKTRVTITAILVIALIVAGINLLNGNNDEAVEMVIANKIVRTQTVESRVEARVEAIGTVKADTKIAVKALTRGTVRSVLFSVGDQVAKNTTLANLSNDTVMTNLINAQTNLVNVERNASITTQLTQETLRRAELETERAEKTVAAAEIGLQSAIDNLNNSKNLSDKGDIDIKNSAVLSMSDNLNTVYNTLKQINTIIQADEDTSQVPGIKNTLAALNQGTLNTALNAYRTTDSSYEALSAKQFNADNITQGIKEMILLLAQTKNAVDTTIVVLDSTITSADFTPAALAAQRDKFTGLRSAIVATQTSVERTLQSLQNTGLTSTQQLDALENAVAAAENQLNSAELSYQNALVGLTNAQTGAERDLLSSQSSVDNAKSQLNLMQVQASDLRISAPITGVVTSKLIDLGDEVNPGQTIAEISQTEKLVIEVDLPASDSSRLESGQIAYITSGTMESTGTVGQIYPTADPVNKKIRVEIIADKDSKLVAESFVNVSIPTKEDTDKENMTTYFVPLKAVTISPNENYVYIIDGEKAKKVQVNINRTEGDKIEVTSGLNEGDQLIVEGNKSIVDGETVTVNN